MVEQRRREVLTGETEYTRSEDERGRSAAAFVVSRQAQKKHKKMKEEVLWGATNNNNLGNTRSSLNMHKVDSRFAAVKEKKTTSS